MANENTGDLEWLRLRCLEQAVLATTHVEASRRRDATMSFARWALRFATEGSAGEYKPRLACLAQAVFATKDVTNETRAAEAMLFATVAASFVRTGAFE